MGNPRIIYNPGGGSRNLDFPNALQVGTTLRRTARRVFNESESGVVMVHFNYFYDDITLVLDKMVENAAFEDELVAFMAHAGAGKGFALAVDSADNFNVTLDVNTAAGATLIDHTASAEWPLVVPGARFVVESNIDGYQREIVTATNPIVADDSFTITSGLIFSYLAGDTVRSINYYPKCVVAQEEFPLDEVEANLRSFRLKVRTYYDIETA